MILNSPSDKKPHEYVIYLSQLPDPVQQDILSMIKYVTSETNLQDDEYAPHREDSDNH